MPLSDELRNELAAITPARECDRLAEVSALFHTAGSVHLLGRGALAVHLDLASSAVARRAFALLRDLGVRSEIRTYRQHAFGRATRYQLHVAGDSDALGVLTRAGVLGPHGRPLERPPRRVVARACCRGAYLRGALLGAGSLSRGESAHLEVRTASRDGAAFLREVAVRQGIAATGVVDRGRHAALYAKGADAIESLLLAAGADGVVLGLEERAVLAATRAHANRLANADHANLVRTSRAAQAQIDAVRRLAADGTLARLPVRLQEAGRLRLRHPTLPLAELARRADPPATKAGMHRRLARLRELAERQTRRRFPA